MLCPTCSTDVAAGASFCPKCGARLGAAPPAPAAATPADKLRAAQTVSAASAEGEQELWHGRYSPKAMYGSWMVAIAVTIAAVVTAVFFPVAWIAAVIGVPVLWLALLLTLAYRWLNEKYTLTTQRLLHKSGILLQRSNRIEAIDIDDVTYVQGIIERLFGVGTIKLVSSDTSDPTLVLHGIDNVQHVANLIDNARRDERRKRGLHMEVV
jgi:uncharacterized membrane protein YdbT with pleckstrin-like domain